jgi:hypothetical protein
MDPHCALETFIIKSHPLTVISLNLSSEAHNDLEYIK